MNYNPYQQYQQFGQTFPPAYNSAYQSTMGSQQQMPMQTTQMQPQMTPQPMQEVSGDMIWVQGIEGAKAYFVARDSMAILWDSENPVIYIKTADSSGIPTTRILDYTERYQNQNIPGFNQRQNNADYVSRDEFNNLNTRLNELTAKYDQIYKEGV